MSGYGQILRNLREAAGLTQRQLAIKAGCTDGYIAFVELGRRLPSAEFLKTLAGALHPSEQEVEQLLQAVDAAHRQRAERKLQSVQTRSDAIRGVVTDRTQSGRENRGDSEAEDLWTRGGGVERQVADSMSDADAAQVVLALAGDAELLTAHRLLITAFADPQARAGMLAALQAFAQMAQRNAGTTQQWERK